MTRYRTIVADRRTPARTVECDLQDIGRTARQRPRPGNGMEVPMHDDPTAVSDLEAGMAGEHLVMADLLLRGYRAIMAEQHCPYDVVVDLDGRLVRLQVKSARQASAETRRSGGQYTPAYKWSTRRTGKRGQRKYGLDGFDALALVALDVRRVAYLRWEGQQHVQMPAPGTVAQPGGNGAIRRVRHDFDLLTFEAAVA